MAENNGSNCPVPTGKLLIIGGAEDKGQDKAAKKQTPSDFEDFQVLKTFIRLTDKEKPVIEVVTSASSEGEELFKDYKKAFDELNINEVGHIHHALRTEVIEDASIIDRLNKADAIFFGGGDQLKYTYLYGGTPFLTRLKERYIDDAIVIGGTSAGAMALSTPMIYAGNDEVQELGGEIKVTTGLEFLKDVCIDTHFVHRGRFVRMAQVVVTNPTSIGIGIEEDTAVIITNGLDVEVVGTGTIIIIDGHSIARANIDEFTDKVPMNVRDLKVHILSDGEKYKIPQTNPPHI